MLKDVEVGKKVLPPGEPVSNKASNTFNIHINIKNWRSQQKQQQWPLHADTIPNR